MPSGSCRTIWSSRCTASLRFDCRFSTTCLRASTCWIWSRSLSISLIWSSSLTISVFKSLLRAFWRSICVASTRWTRPTTATAAIASSTASDTNCRLRAWRFCARCGRRLMRTEVLMRAASRAVPWLFEAAQREPRRDRQERRVLRELARPDAVGHLHRRERVADHGGDARALGDELVEPRQQRAAARQNDLVDLVVRRRREEELQRAGDLERERLHERLQHVVVVVLRQALVLLRRLGFLGRQVEGALDVERELVAAERLVAGEQELVVAQYVEMGDVGADVDEGDVLVAAVGRQRRRDHAERLLRRVRLDVHHRRAQAGRLGDRHAVLDLLLARGRDQHLDLVGVVRRGPQDLEIEVDLVERERDILVGFRLDGEL